MPLLRAIGQLARSSTKVGSAGSHDSLRTRAEETVSAALSRKPLQGIIFRTVLKLARSRVRDRENLRFERTRVYGRVRAIFIEVGRRLHLQPEPTNPYDPNAIRVFAEDKTTQIGYLPKEVAAETIAPSVIRTP